MITYEIEIEPHDVVREAIESNPSHSNAENLIMTVLTTMEDPSFAVKIYRQIAMMLEGTPVTDWDSDPKNNLVSAVFNMAQAILSDAERVELKKRLP